MSGHATRCEHAGGALGEPRDLNRLGGPTAATAMSSRYVASGGPSPPTDAPRVRQPSARGNPAKAGSSTAFRPKRASSLGCHGRTAAAKGRMTAGKWVSAG